MHPITAVQVEYSPFSTDIEDEKIGLLEACRELGIKVVVYGVLGRGLLTGKFVRSSITRIGSFAERRRRKVRRTFRSTTTGG